MVKVKYCIVIAVVFKECLIRSNDLCIFLQPRTDARAEANNTLNAISRQEGITDNIFSLLAYPIYTASALDKPYNSPWKVVVYNNGAVLKVLAFAENVRCNDNTKFLLWPYLASFVVAFRAEMPCNFCWVF